MASGSVDMEEETNCSICIECLKDPVTVDCGHNFCRACITSYCEEQEGIRDLECPLCKLRIQKETFRSNWQLANIIEKIKFLAPNLRKEDLCAKHHEKLNLFCEEDTALICVICERAPEHKAHHVVLKEEAAQKYKDEIWNCLEALRKETEKIQAYRTDVEKESQNFLDETKSTREKTVAIFKEIRLFLEEQEKVLLGRIEEVEKDIAKKKDEHLAKLSEELSSLGELILEMEKKHQQSASELLQDIKRTLKR
ncbi:tripartite motif-containing protein 10-like [Anolis sagrei]|uniref:tripartite motif-containing protein 10-like n=1 Tax=Anolis sagrei TaxID=38937 RepID=UPI003521340A